MKNLKNSFDSLEKLILDLRIENLNEKFNELNKSLQKLNLETEELEEDFQNLKTN